MKYESISIRSARGQKFEFSARGKKCNITLSGAGMATTHMLVSGRQDAVKVAGLFFGLVDHGKNKGFVNATNSEISEIADLIEKFCA